MKTCFSNLFLFCALFLFSCQSGGYNRDSDQLNEIAPVKAPKRVGMVTGLDPTKADYYKKLHANTWEGVLAAINKYNIRNYSIYIKQIEGKLYLFSYYEYIGDDYESDMKRIAADTVTQRWWRETDPCQIPLPEAKAGAIWTNMEEVFHAD